MADTKTPGIGNGAPGPGRGKGTPNKINADVKAMVLEALHHAGGAEYLCMQAYDNPKAFMALVGRVLPLSLANQDGGPLAGVVLIPMKAPTIDG